MALFCYLKKSAYGKIILSPNGLTKKHSATELMVYSDARGFYVPVNLDIFQNPDFVLRDDLSLDIEWYSALINVAMPVYTDQNSPTGDYDVGDPKVRLVMSSKNGSINGALHREMSLKAPTWEKLRSAIEKIRAGEVTPVDCGHSVLERRDIELAEVERTNVLLGAEFMQLTDEYNRLQSELHEAQTLSAEDKRVSAAVADYLAGTSNTVCLGVSTDPRYVRLQTEAAKAKAAITELARIRATRWYKLGQYFSVLDITAPNS